MLTLPEFELLRLAARAEPDAARTQNIRAAAGGVDDWDRVIEWGHHHRILPLLYAHLRDAGVVPEAHAKYLRQWALRAAADVLFLSSEMVRIGTALDKARVPYLILKGPSLAEAYGGTAKRPFSDNDLLVRPIDFGKVERALLEAGFGERKRGDRQQSGYLSVYGEYTFGRSVGTFVSTVDVHTRVVPPGYSYSPDFDGLHARSRAAEMGGKAVLFLSWEDLFLTLSVNAVKDQWSRLRLATDLAEVAPLIGDWDALTERARQEGGLRTLHLAVLVAHGIVGGSFPCDVLENARRDRTAVALADRVQSSLATVGEGRAVRWVDRVRLNLGVQDGLAGMARYMGYVAVRRVTERAVDPRR